MLCEVCGQRPATVHRTEIINNQKIQKNLCDLCAAKNQPEFRPLSLSELLGGLIDTDGPQPPKASDPHIRCSLCGMTYNEFRTHGRFGCPNDIKLFEQNFLPLCQKIHGATAHVGKVPTSDADRMRDEKELLKLNRQLEQAISAEKYEKAAKLRDRIKEIEGRYHGD